MTIAEIILNKDKKDLFLKTDRGNFILTFNEPIYFELVSYVAEKQMKDKKIVLINPADKYDEFKIRLYQIKAEYLNKKQSVNIDSAGTFLIYYRERFRLLYEAHVVIEKNGKKIGKKKITEGYILLYYADTNKRLVHTDEEQKKLADKICEQLFRFHGFEYWLGDITGTTIKIVPEETSDTKDITIPRIKDILNRYKTEKPELFRSFGPQEIDFEQKYVAERKEVIEKVMSEFQKQNLVVIKGDPASGKSVILRNIGFNIAKQGNEVYVIELKDGYPDEYPDVNEVFKIEQGYLLIDDAHLGVKYVQRIINELCNKSIKVKVLISSRDIKKFFDPTSLSTFPRLLKEAIPIEAYDAMPEILEIFGKKEKEITEEIRRNLTKNNLWILAWELKAYKKSGRIDEIAVSETIMDYMQEGLKSFGVDRAEDIFLPLSVFYKYEISVRKKFIEELIENKHDIERLIELGEINVIRHEGIKYLTLHHSEIANVFLKAFWNLKEFGVKIKEKLGENWFELLFFRYVENFPNESPYFITKFRGGYYELEFIENLLETHFNKFKKGLEETNFLETCFYIREIFDLNKGIGKNLLKSLNFQKLKAKIEALDLDVITNFCIWWTNGIDEEFTQNMILIAKDKIIEEGEKIDIKKLWSYVHLIERAKKEIKAEIVKTLDSQLHDKIIIEKKQFKEIDDIIHRIAKISEDVASKLEKLVKII